jgi:RNA recognition motif-containing protein
MKKNQKKNLNPKKEQDSEDDSSEKPKKGNKKADKKKSPKKDSDSESEKPRAKVTQKKDNDDDEELPENAYEELFVRNIGFNTTEKELADFFGNYGDVEEAKIITDKQTGKSKGFGFLKFYEKKSAVAAMNDADNIVVGGRNLQIRYSNDKSGPIRGGGNNGGKKGPQSEFGIFVGNISYKCTENDLKKFFKDCGKVLDVRLAKKPDGKLKGFAHVDFETKEGVDKAVEKNGEELQGRALKIDRSTGGKGGAGGNGNRGGPARGGRGREPIDPLAKARKTGGIIAPKENKVTTYDDSSDDE